MGLAYILNSFDSKNWHNNIFQVTNQVTMESKYVNRYDVTILINGLPMVQIELKRRGKDFKEALIKLRDIEDILLKDYIDIFNALLLPMV